MTPGEPTPPDPEPPRSPGSRHRRTAADPSPALLGDPAAPGGRNRSTASGYLHTGKHRKPPKLRLARVAALIGAASVLGILASSNPLSQTARDTHLTPVAAPVKPITPAASSPTPASAPPTTTSAPAPPPESTTTTKPPETTPAKPPETTTQEQKPKDQIGQWIDEALKILADNGVDTSKADPGDIRTIIMYESGGNPNAANNWDSNAAAGTPSMGLMQTIRPTFTAYALPGHTDILNPVDNIIAGVRYAIATYGSVANVRGVANLKNGGSYAGY